MDTPHAPTADGPDDWLELNRNNWEDRVPIHLTSDFYDVEGFRAGGDALRAYEVEEVGEVRGRRLLHLQCHFGMDTLSWGRRGARVTGLDFSPSAVETARALARDVDQPGARFVTSDVYRAVEALGNATFDIVYTGVGALCWLPDIPRWARVVSELVEPGGFLYLNEFHPVTDMLDEDGRSVVHDYFEPAGQVEDIPHSYTGDQPLAQHIRTVQWSHPLGEVVTSLLEAGLRIELLRERDFTMFSRYPDMERDGVFFRFPAGRPRVPLMYSLRARKPEAG